MLMQTAAPEALIRQVVAQAQSFVEPDGKLEVLSAIGATVRVRYTVAKNPTCAECVLRPEDLQLFLKEMFSREAPQIREVEVEATTAA
jgi:hypothetical protein